MLAFYRPSVVVGFKLVYIADPGSLAEQRPELLAHFPEELAIVGALHGSQHLTPVEPPPAQHYRRRIVRNLQGWGAAHVYIGRDVNDETRRKRMAATYIHTCYHILDPEKT
jgi:hypothetical protein